jgi:hypothetical protein
MTGCSVKRPLYPLGYGGFLMAAGAILGCGLEVNVSSALRGWFEGRQNAFDQGGAVGLRGGGLVWIASALRASQ